MVAAVVGLAGLSLLVACLAFWIGRGAYELARAGIAHADSGRPAVELLADGGDADAR